MEKLSKHTSMETLLNTLPLWTIYADQNNKIIWASDGILNHLGVSLDDISGKSCYEVLLSSNGKCDECSIPKHDDHADLKTVKKIDDDNGLLIHCKPIKEGLNEYEKTPGTLIFIEDINELLEKSDRMEFLLSLLRHDINNKLQIIEGYLELMKEDGDFTADQEKYLERALKAENEATNLIKKAQTAIKMKDAEIYKINITPVLYNLLSQLEFKLKEQGIDIKIDLENCYIKGGDLLEEVFHNLIHNSIEHSGCELIRIQKKKKRISTR